MLKILALSTTTLFLSTSAFDDNTATPPNQLSEDKDHGWGKYKEYYPDDYLCDNPASCQRTGVNTYYGPFIGDNSNYFLERNFECPDGSDAIVTISYDVISCGADGSKDKSTPYVDLNMGSKNTIGTGSTIITDAVLSENAGYPDTVSCSGSWTSQSVTDSSFPTVAGGCKFTAKIRTKLTSATETAYIANIKVECAALTTDSACCGVCSGGGSTPLHDEYCVDGFTGTDAKYNGEYTVYQDNNGNPQQAGTGNKVFVKLHGDVAYIYEETVTSGGSTQYRWVIGSGAGTGPFAYCPLKTASQSFLDIATDCTSLTPAPYTSVSIADGECAGHHTVADLWALLDVVSSDREKLLVVMVGLSVFSCFMGMMICVCCQLMCRVCCKGKENYEKVVNKELDDDYL